MFFRSPNSLVLAVLLLLIGSYQLFRGWDYKDASQHEAATVGRLLDVYHGGRGGSTYQYRFEANGVAIRDDSSTCKTALTQAGCVAGAPVVVYYDRDRITTNLLQEFGEASREKMFMGAFMTGCAILLVGLHFLFKKLLKSPDESDDTSDEDTLTDQPDVIHVVPES